MMGDECTCEKCGVNSSKVQDAVVWCVGRAEAQAEGRVGPAHEQYLVIGKSGIALRQQTTEGQA